MNTVTALMHVTILRAQAYHLERIIDDRKYPVDVRKKAEQVHNGSLDAAQRIADGQHFDPLAH